MNGCGQAGDNEIQRVALEVDRPRNRTLEACYEEMETDKML